MAGVTEAKSWYAWRYQMKARRVLALERVRQWLDNLRHFQDTA